MRGGIPVYLYLSREQMRASWLYICAVGPAAACMFTCIDVAQFALCGANVRSKVGDPGAAGLGGPEQWRQA